MHACTVATLVVLLAVTSTASGEIDRNQFVDREWKVEQLVVPRDWQLSEQRAYPGLLVWAIHRDGPGRITLVAERVTNGVGAREVAEHTRETLSTVGFQVGRVTPHPSGAFLLEVTTPDKKTRLRQGTTVVGDIAYVLTIAAPPNAMTGYTRTFDDTLGHLRLGGPRTLPGPGPTQVETTPDPRQPASQPVHP